MKKRAKYTQRLIDEVNLMLRKSTCKSEVREGMIAVIDVIIHQSGTYKGFRYLAQEEVPPNEEPGTLGLGDTRTYPDPTRRRYL